LEEIRERVRIKKEQQSPEKLRDLIDAVASYLETRKT